MKRNFNKKVYICKQLKSSCRKSIVGTFVFYIMGQFCYAFNHIHLRVKVIYSYSFLFNKFVIFYHPLANIILL